MAILQVSDFPKFVPSVPTTDTNYVEGLIYRAQAYAESALGSNRPLEAANYIEIYDVVPAVPTEFYLSNSPIIFTPNPVVLENMVGTPSVWKSIETDNFVVESSGRVELDLLRTGHLTFNLGNDYVRPISVRVRATYDAGFDFTQDNRDINLIKAIVGQLIVYLHQLSAADNATSSSSSTTASGGVKEFESKDDTKIVYSDTVASTTSKTVISSGKFEEAIKQILFPLRRYSPKDVYAI